MQLTVGDIAEKLGATVEGDALTPVSGVAGIADAGTGDITFCAHPRLAELIPKSPASVIIVDGTYTGPSLAALVRVDDPYAGFLKVLKLFRADTPERPPGVHPTAIVDPSARLGSDVSVGALCVVEDEVVLENGVTLSPGVFVGARGRIAEGCYLYPNVTIREGVDIGKRVIIHAGTVIGSDGFGYLSRSDCHEKVPQVGTVIVEDDVEIGANVAIDRGTLGATRIGRGVKIDNLVHIAHNVTVGEDTLLVAQVGISGSTQIGRKATLAGQAGVVGHIRIGDGAQIGAQAGVTKSIPDHTRVSGYPAMEHDRARRLNAYYRKLPGLFEQIKVLEDRVRELEAEREKIL
jgi:UDP-3-O-[3-hydroxymyristoyl] glucosamine N-acyltransferase